MKRFLLAGLCVLGANAHAQTATESPQSAAAFVDVKPQDYPTPERSKAQNLRFERLAVARNRDALKQFRAEFARDAAAFAEAINAGNANQVLARSRNTRDLARLLVWESDVRLNDGDASGAMSSRLDAFALAIPTARGASLMSALVGSAAQSLALGNIEPIAAKLDANALEDAANRLQALESKRPSFVDVLNLERERTLREFRGYFNSPQWAQITAKPTTLGIDETQLAQLRTLSQAQIEANISRVYDDALKRARLPYPQAQKTEIAPGADAYSRLMTQSAEGKLARWSFERTRAQSYLLIAALERKSRQLQNDAAPFDLPPDPFGNGFLKRKNDSIYSVGPDGIDDGGTPFRDVRFWFDRDSGTFIKRINTRIVQTNTKGDVLAPIF